jgi:hypothetical protein
LETLIHCSKVDFGKDKRLEISSTDKLPFVAIFTASSRNSFVYRPLGILAIFTPPYRFLPKHWCPFFSTYHTAVFERYFGLYYAVNLSTGK